MRNAKDLPVSPARRLLWFAASLAVAAGLVLLWHVASAARWVAPTFLPAPAAAWAALVGGLQEGELLGHLRHTLVRMGWGWCLASLAGIAVGAAIGVSASLRAALEPTLEALRPLPASALVPVAIAVFGRSEQMVLSVIAFGSCWPVLLATVHAFGQVEPRLEEVARAMNMTPWQRIRTIVWPGAVPDILAACRVGATVSLILTVVGEMLTGLEGLGSHVLVAARTFRGADLYAGVLLLAAIGVATAYALEALERRALRWRDGP